MQPIDQLKEKLMERGGVVLAFKKANSFLEKLIDFWTRKDRFDKTSCFSHVEIVMMDPTYKFPNSLSARAWDYHVLPGMTYKFIQYSHPERWKFVHVTENSLIMNHNTNLQEIREKAQKVKHLKYDWKGIFLLEFLPFKIHSKKRFYCSELAAYLLNIEPAQVSPNELYKKLMEYKV